MSVIVTIKVEGDSAQMREFLTVNGDRLTSIVEAARATGGVIHHEFAIGDGFLLVIDEWDNAGSFDQFFSSHNEIAGMMQEAGATGAPEVTIAERIETADRF